MKKIFAGILIALCIMMTTGCKNQGTQATEAETEVTAVDSLAVAVDSLDVETPVDSVVAE